MMKSKISVLRQERALDVVINRQHWLERCQKGTSLPSVENDRTTAILWVLVSAIAIFLAVAMGLPGGRSASDSSWYRMLACGQVRQVVQPFASRQLEPRLVALISSVLHVEVDVGFELIAALSTLVCIAGIGHFFARSRVPLIAFVATACLPIWSCFDHGPLLPDIFYSAIFLLFLLCLWREHLVIATCLFPLLYIARESTLLAFICFVIAGFRRVKPQIMIAATVSVVVGAYADSRLASGSLANIHHLNPIMYMIGKVPFNAAKNLFGIEIWTNTLSTTSNPIWSHHLPAFVHLGGIKQVGIQAFSLYLPLWALLCWFGLFGVLPLVFWTSWKNGSLDKVKNNFFLRFCVTYGLLSFVLGPMLGASLPRLIAYGWPLFLVALPVLCPEIFRNIRLVAINLVCGWLSWCVALSSPPNAILIAALIGVMVCWILAHRELKTTYSVSNPQPMTTTIQMAFRKVACDLRQ